jgi:hypothetical protein
MVLGVEERKDVEERKSRWSCKPSPTRPFSYLAYIGDNIAAREIYVSFGRCWDISGTIKEAGVPSGRPEVSASETTSDENDSQGDASVGRKIQIQGELERTFSRENTHVNSCDFLDSSVRCRSSCRGRRWATFELVHVRTASDPSQVSLVSRSQNGWPEDFPEDQPISWRGIQPQAKRPGMWHNIIPHVSTGLTFSPARATRK